MMAGVRVTFGVVAAIIVAALSLAGCGADNAQPGLHHGSSTQGGVMAVRSGAAAADYADVVQKVYAGYFGRPADGAGLAYYQDVFFQVGAPATIVELSTAYDSNPTIRSVLDGFGMSQESMALYNGSNTEFIRAIYRNVFSHEADLPGLNYWAGLLDAGQITRARAAIALMAGARGTDADTVNKKAVVANMFTAQIATPEQVAAYSGLAANEVVRALLQNVGADTDLTTVQPAINDAVAKLVSIAGTGTNKLLIQAWLPDGRAASINDFVDYTHYVTGKWSAYSNYGVFRLGSVPATAQIGSDIHLSTVDQADVITVDVPNNVPFYFTSLWKAPVIGTVHMRADNKGQGLSVDSTRTQRIEIPYDFAVSEYAQAHKLMAAGTLSSSAQSLLAKATSALDDAAKAPGASQRAVAAYTALSYIMPLKEQLVLDASDSAIAKMGARTDFDLNYEGFGSWIDTKFTSGYVVAKEAGFQSVLLNVEWPVVLPARGTYDFSVLDYKIDQARKLGFKVALNVNANGDGLAPWARSLSFAELKSLYFETARTVVSRYGSKISWYYAASELELGKGAWTLEQLGELAQESLAGARAAAPSMPFGLYVSASAYVPYQMNVGPNASYVSGYDLVHYLKKNGVAFDFIGLEMQYGTTFAPIDLQRFQEVIQDFYNVVQVPVYMGETGYSSKGEDYLIAAPFYWHDGLTQRSQYEWAAGTLKLLYALPFVKGYYWVHLDPDTDDYNSDYLSSLIGTNLLRADGTKKQALSAFKEFTAKTVVH